MSRECGELYGFFFVLGALLAAGFTAMLFLTAPITTLGEARAARKTCELELPRNQKCVITAVPEVQEQ